MKNIFRNKNGLMWACALFLGLFTFSTNASAQLINELAINPPGIDQPCEYVEITGTPGSTISNTYFLAVDGDATASGNVDYVFDLSGQTIGSNGILIVIAQTQCGSRTYPPATTVIQDSTLDSSNGLENGTISFLLVSSPTPIVQGTDFDTDDDGNPESFPGTATIIDAVGWTDGGSSDNVYGGVILAFDNFAPDAATRFQGDTSSASASAWYTGNLTDDGNGNATVTYNPGDVSANFPSGGMLTPGDVNVGTPAVPGNANVDFNGDGQSDFVVTRSAAGLGATQLRWLISENGSGNFFGSDWGISSDRRAPADYDGDGKDDIAIWRPNTGNGNAAFYILNSSNSTVRVDIFGVNGDNPRVVGDYDGDGTDDVAVYRQNAGGQNFFFYRASSNNPNGDITFVPWGSGEFVRPNKGDYDGDGKHDFCIFNQAGQFVLLRSSDLGIEYVKWGIGSEALVPGDFDNDGMDDFCVVRLDNNQRNWFILERDGGGTGAGPIIFGLPSDFLTPGDYDGDGRQDVAVWRPSEGRFYILQSSNNSLSVFKWGSTGDNPEANWMVHESGVN